MNYRIKHGQTVGDVREICRYTEIFMCFFCLDSGNYMKLK